MTASTPAAAVPGGSLSALQDIILTVGSSRQTYVVERGLHADPRFVLHGGLGEERYDALICVPIVARSDRLVGVVSVWSPTAGHFTAEHVRLAEWIAVVV